MNNINGNILNYINIKKEVLNFFLKYKNIILPFVFIISYVLFYFLIDFSSQSLVAHDEGLYARRARLIQESSNWFTPPFETPHHKTLGSYWFIALSINLFGKSELALRLPSILASFLCLIISYLISLMISNKKSALISLFSLSSIPLWIQYSRYASPDFPFLLCILLVIFFFLKFLESYKYKYLYIFLSGLFVSSSFFIRSFMIFVPLIGLTPFIVFHLYRKRNIFKIIFFIGIALGSIPSFLNLYYSFIIYGNNGIASLFDFAKKQAIEGFDFNNIFYIPLNFIYFTFPVGILLCLLFVFTRSNNNIRYPLLTYYYPFISLVILLSMSTSYPHYYLFLLPSLSFLFGVKIESYTFKNDSSSYKLYYILITLIIFICSLIVFILFYFNHYLLDFLILQRIVLFSIISFLFLSYFSSLRLLFDNQINKLNLTKFFLKIIIPQYISLSILYNFGILGNPNSSVKSFLNDKNVSSIINSNTIYLYSVDSKIKTLLSFYLPFSNVITTLDDFSSYKYVITSKSKFLDKSQSFSQFRSIKKLDNHFLLFNISK